MNTRRGFLARLAALGAVVTGIRPEREAEEPIAEVPSYGGSAQLMENHATHLQAHSSLLKEVYGRQMTQHIAAHQAALWDKLGA